MNKKIFRLIIYSEQGTDAYNFDTLQQAKEFIVQEAPMFLVFETDKKNENEYALDDKEEVLSGVIKIKRIRNESA